MRIIFLSPPAAGKGTQAKIIQERTNIPLIVMGDILREAIQRKDEVGIQAEKYVKQGELVPDHLVIKIIMMRLEQDDCKRSGFLLDGFPRTLDQAKALDEAMTKNAVMLDYVVYYAIDDQIAIKRVCGRRICKNCGAIYHLMNKPPLKPNKCDLCNGDLFQRSDDTAEVMTTRLSAYHQKTAVLLDYYRKKNLVVEINANRSIEEILNETLSKLKLSIKK